MKKSVLFASIAFALSITVTSCSMGGGGSSGGENLNPIYLPVTHTEVQLPSGYKKMETVTVEFPLSNLDIDADSEVWFLQTNTGNSVCESTHLSAADYMDFNFSYAHNDLLPFVEADIEWEWLESGARNANLIPYKSALSPDYKIGDKKDFYINETISTSPTVWKDTVTRSAELVEKGKYCNVWFAKDLSATASLPEASVSQIKSLVSVFDYICPAEVNLLGDYGIIIKNGESVLLQNNGFYGGGKIDILVIDIDGDKSPDSGVAGEFWSGDIYKQISSGGKILNCNNELMFYVDSYMLANDANFIYSTLVHEFNHMLNYTNKHSINEIWFTELLSAMTEDVMVNGYLSEFLSDSGLNPVMQQRVPYFNGLYYYGFKDWGSEGSYGNAYGFGAYLLRNFGGIRLLHEIATNEYTGDKAIIEALNKLNVQNSYKEVLGLYPLALINTDGGMGSLNRSVSGILGSYRYSLDAINLKKYYSYYIEGEDSGWSREAPYYLDFNQEPVDTLFTGLAMLPIKLPSDVINDSETLKMTWKTDAIDDLTCGIYVKTGNSGKVYFFDMK